MSRLVAVSNRVGPLKGGASAGGLAVGLIDALRESRGLWFGWSGTVRPDAEETVHHREGDGVDAAVIDLPTEAFERYYNGFANRCLWPLVHFRMDLIHYDAEDFAGYRQVNQRFARALLPLLRPDDLIWIHDYHLFPLAAELRALGARQRIGFFLHTPFPPADLLTTLPPHEALVRTLFDYDLFGVQTEADLHRFRDYICRVAGGTADRNALNAWGRRLVAQAFPIGIDAAQFQELSCSPIAQREVRRMREHLRGRDQIIGVDRLDYTKGLLRRLAAYELMLERHDDAHQHVEFLQIAPISRGEVQAYRDFRTELEQTAAHINGRFARVDWTPIRYLNAALPRRAVAGLLRASRIGLVTPMRDGMNLVAKEYVAAQDPADPGVLVLSRFAGAAQQMQAAMLVNPYDSAEVADALQVARQMPLPERRRRHEELMQGLLAEDVNHWRERFVAALQAVPPRRRPDRDPARR